MKIGIDARPLAIRRAGIGNYVYNIVKELYKIDTENEYYLYAHKHFELPFSEDERWHKCIHPHKIGTLWYCTVLPGILKKDGIDVLWGTQHVLPFGNKHIKHVLTIHDLAMFYFPHVSTRYNYLVNRLLVPYSARKADKIIAVSKSTAEDIKKILKVDNAKIEMIYEAAEEKYCKKDRDMVQRKMIDKYHLPEDYILYLGTLEPRKNVETLLKAYKKSMDTAQIRNKLVIAGGKGWKYEGIYRLIHELGIGNDVIFPGYIEDEDMVDLYNAAALFVFPSIYEGFGLPVLEAMRCAVPVITTDASSLPEVGGEAAVLIDPHDIDKLSTNINHILLDTAYRESLREKSFIQAGKFSWDSCAEETYRVLIQK